ncbi:hypothetical protein QQS21_004360 [Conoideocrella luteorostrata]|uniref:Ams2/SPT21 N-terminal domain-containing protein n=1 Tax=Conoideocrella luteorostrata TaxID=1105319 RepID=A0AAJ0CUL6_9HYPO|nr:hypothetical protein QQS21_004360 [Conoideocrella luteorostrata]
MASPVPVGAMGNGSWNSQYAQHQQQTVQHQRSQQQQHMPPQTEADESGLHSRPMGLKVHYTFDKEGKVNCLARYPQTFHIQTVPIDETNFIGIIDLRSCIHAIIECSPELTGQESDYTIYAVDFSEPDTPLVGQGMLSRALDSIRNDSMMQQPKMVTGRVTKNLLGVFGGGNRETLEVRLRLSEAARPNRHVRHNSSDFHQSRPMENAMTPTGTSEWNSFMQSNPHIGQNQTQMGHVSRVASPALSQGQGHHPNMMGRRDSFGPTHQHQHQPQQPHQMITTMSGQEVQRIAPIPVDPSERHVDGVAPSSSRPSSRTSNRAPRRKPPTGRPRGRPRKKPVEGNTSGYEDGTEGEDGPTKKRAKTTVVEKATPNPFANGPESLRVAASTAGSLRNFRPILANNDGASGDNSHLQEIPRAPTPVPNGPMRNLPGAGPGPAKLRRESALSQQPLSNNSSFAESGRPLSPSQDDGRSPDSIAPTPLYSEASPADIGSSPPVQRATPFLRSSPPPSSPVLPPMPPTELPCDTSFATDDLDDLFGDEPIQVAPKQIPPRVVPLTRKPTEARNASGIPIQVFQMQDGPGGQDMVHICSYNTPQPNSNPANALSDNQSLPPLKKAPMRIAAKKKPKPTSPPGMAPTPPPTTDAVEKPVSPALTAEAGMVEKGNVTSVHKPAMAPQTTIEPSQTKDISKDSEKDDGKDAQKQSPKKPEIAPVPVIQKAPRQLSRSQSAGPLALPTMPASEPAGSSSLSQSIFAEPERPAPPVASTLKRAASTGPLTLPNAASDPVVPIAAANNTSLPDLSVPRSDAIPTPSSPPATSRSNKNIVKKHAIKQRLEEAIMNGEMPPYCSNCGAIETPTWRKIWVQENDGVPEYCEYSVEPGKITAIEILKRDAEDRPTLHRLIKKSLGSDDDKAKWQERLLCNPCGIWLTKCKSHRPQDRWDKDASRLGQERRKRGSGRSTSRAKKSRGRSDVTVNPTSEAYFHTDALGPIEPSSPKQPEGDISGTHSSLESGNREVSANTDVQDTQSNPGSTHSRGSRESGAGKSPVDMEFDEAVGSTKRLLFPSPRKEGVLKTLSEVHVNIMQTPDECRPKGTIVGKENVATTNTDGQNDEHNGISTLLKSPAGARPSTPPPNSKTGTPNEPFKTPTRPTPNHRPITRSISRSIRSIRSVASPGQLASLQRTPTKTPRVAFGNLGSVGHRRSPRNHQGEFEIFDTPISRTISQMFSDGTGFGDNDLDLSNLPALDGSAGGFIDFGNLLSTDAVMPSSPPRDGSMSFDYHASSSVWAQWDLDSGSMDTT